MLIDPSFNCAPPPLQVISVGHGREGENGRVTANDAVKPGDLVFVKDPYGIGERGGGIGSSFSVPPSLPLDAGRCSLALCHSIPCLVQPVLVGGIVPLLSRA